MHSELDELLAGSSAPGAFKSDVLSFFESGRAERITVRGYSPRVKVARVLKHLLATHPELDIESILIDGRSGCSDFAGTAHVATQSGTQTFEFVWCCRWRAEQEGWVDYYGFPDQMRAAREYDWRCFQVWRATSES
jgi:hypothetical protein